MKTKSLLSPDAAKQRHKTHVRVAMSLYAVMLLTCVYCIKHDPPGPLDLLLALLPTLPVIWVMWSMVRALKPHR